MVDTHCHLNFSRFKDIASDVVLRAEQSGVKGMLIPGTDFVTSKKAIEIAHNYKNIYVAIGIHPHHAFALQEKGHEGISENIEMLESLITEQKVVAIGEIGLDKHIYLKTKYGIRQVDRELLALQKELLVAQMDLALTYKKSLILHNWEAKEEILAILSNRWDRRFERRSVFHCCEPDMDLLEFAHDHKMFIGVDGDVTYDKKKEEFIKKVPLDSLVLETDSPYLLPEPLRSQKKYPNEPSNLFVIAQYIAKVLSIDVDEIIRKTTENAQILFSLSS